jgi:tetratricopeptide (TPR) repeat protein
MALADHGESLGEHGEDEHGVFLYEPVMRIPWIAAGPGIAPGRVITDQVRSIDLVPTVMSTLGVPAPQDCDGEDLTSLLRGNARAASAPTAYFESYYPRLHYGWSELRAIRADGWKVIDAPKPELYNLRDDPRELRNVYDGQRVLADRMMTEAARLDLEFTGGVSVQPAQPDRETMERLRSLGYVGTSSPAAPNAATGDRGADPKDRIKERREFKVLMSSAIDDLRGGRATQAIDTFKRLIVINERAYDLHQLLGEAYQAVGRLPEALGEYEYASLLNPRTAAPMLAAAEVHLSMGNVAAARKRRDQAAALDAESFDVSMVTGRILEAEGRVPEALAAYEQAVSRNAANPKPRMLLAGVASRLQRYDLADTQLRALLAMGYQPSRTHFALGRLAQMRGDVATAERHYRDALRLEPGLAMAAEALRAIGR